MIDQATIEQLAQMRRDTPVALISSRIRRARKTMGLSHDGLASKLGMTRQQLIKLEKPLYKPRLETIVRIADATGRDPEWFLNADVDPSPFQDDEPRRSDA